MVQRYCNKSKHTSVDCLMRNKFGLTCSIMCAFTFVNDKESSTLNLLKLKGVASFMKSTFSKDFQYCDAVLQNYFDSIPNMLRLYL